ncbi:ABC transporter permease [Thermopetrobacter sp. TC1]|uniref:ABC transporter permease n=1 Tax=Thermopetrobacter sp. TC1 TaxID=1495045 RepID=UPI000B1C2DBD|nr:ABC transporter permease [Thermopetrobacter sp. TC1]
MKPSMPQRASPSSMPPAKAGTARQKGALPWLGRMFMGLWYLAGLGAAWIIISNFDADVFKRYGPRMLSGLLVTTQLVVLPLVMGAVIGLGLALMRLSGQRWLSLPANVYMTFFRGTPLLAQVFLIYYGAGQLRPWLQDVGLWGFFREAWYCVLLAFTLNTAAYQAEIYRVAIASVPKGQWEAADALGLPRRITFVRIILPQALITALRPLGNEVILMIKASAIASVVTILDLMGVTRLAFARTFDFSVYLWAAVLYLIIVETLRRLWTRLEARLTRHLGQQARAGKG